jgi:hypothetical protein
MSKRTSQGSNTLKSLSRKSRPLPSFIKDREYSSIRELPALEFWMLGLTDSFKAKLELGFSWYVSHILWKIVYIYSSFLYNKYYNINEIIPFLDEFRV